MVYCSLLEYFLPKTRSWEGDSRIQGLIQVQTGCHIPKSSTELSALNGAKGNLAMRRHQLWFALVFVLASSAVAQTKISGSFDCDKSDLIHVIPIPDREGFSL